MLLPHPGCLLSLVHLDRPILQHSGRLIALAAGDHPRNKILAMHRFQQAAVGRDCIRAELRNPGREAVSPALGWRLPRLCPPSFSYGPLTFFVGPKRPGPGQPETS